MIVGVPLLGAMSSAVERAESFDVRWLLPALLLQVGSLAFLGLAWRNVLAAVYPGRVPTVPVACAYVTGAALNGFTPARAGEGAKVALARARITGSSVATIASSLSLLLLIDGAFGAFLVAILWATGVLPTLPLPALPHWGAVPLAVIAGAFAIGVATAIRFLLPRVRSLIASLLEGLAVLRSPSRYLCTVAPLQVGAWVCRIGVVYLLLRAFHVQTGLGAVLLLVVLNGAATAVPAPGGAGSQQVLSTYALRGTLSAAGAVSFSLAMQVGITVFNTVLGLAAASLLVRARPLAALRAVRG